MRTLGILLAMGIVAPALAADPAALTGSWTATRAERDGAPAEDLIGHRLEFAGSHFRIARPDGQSLYAGTFASDAAAQPARIDFHHDSGAAAGRTWEGIYRLDGATLTIVDDAPDPAKGRPDAFAAPAGSGRVLLTFER